jgi:alpha- and gamma-adaptin-binding protein p34
VMKALGGFVVVFALPSTTDRHDGGEDGRRSVTALIQEAGQVYREQLGGWGWDGVALVVGVGNVAGPEELEVWEDVCGEVEMEFVHVGRVGGPQAGIEGETAEKEEGEERNQFGEKVGMQRVLEALESNDWAAVSDELDDRDDGSDDADGFGAWEAARPHRGAEDRGSGLEADGLEDEDEMFDPAELDFGFDKADFKGLRKAIWSAGRVEEEEDMIDSMAQGRDVKLTTPARAGAQANAAQAEAQARSPVAMGQSVPADDLDDGDEPGEEEVQKLDVMMRKLLAVRDMSAGLPEEQRRRIAARAVGEVMKEL